MVNIVLADYVVQTINTKRDFKNYLWYFICIDLLQMFIETLHEWEKKCKDNNILLIVIDFNDFLIPLLFLFNRIFCL